MTPCPDSAGEDPMQTPTSAAIVKALESSPTKEKTMSTRSGGVPIKPPPGTGGSVKTTAKPKPKPKG